MKYASKVKGDTYISVIAVLLPSMTFCTGLLTPEYEAHISRDGARQV